MAININNPENFRKIVVIGIAVILLLALIFLATRRAVVIETKQLQESVNEKGNTEITYNSSVQEESAQRTLEILKNNLIAKYGSLENVPPDLIIDVPGALLGKNELEKTLEEANPLTDEQKEFNQSKYE